MARTEKAWNGLGQRSSGRVRQKFPRTTGGAGERRRGQSSGKGQAGSAARAKAGAAPRKLSGRLGAAVVARSVQGAIAQPQARIAAAVHGVELRGQAAGSRPAGGRWNKPSEGAGRREARPDRQPGFKPYDRKPREGGPGEQERGARPWKRREEFAPGGRGAGSFGPKRFGAPDRDRNKPFDPDRKRVDSRPRPGSEVGSKPGSKPGFASRSKPRPSGSTFAGNREKRLDSRSNNPKAGRERPSSPRKPGGPASGKANFGRRPSSGRESAGQPVSVVKNPKQVFLVRNCRRNPKRDRNGGSTLDCRNRRTGRSGKEHRGDSCRSTLRSAEPGVGRDVPGLRLEGHRS